MDDRYASFWLYAARDPMTGTGRFLLLPDVAMACLEYFLHRLKREAVVDTISVVPSSGGMLLLIPWLVFFITHFLCV